MDLRPPLAEAPWAAMPKAARAKRLSEDARVCIERHRRADDAAPSTPLRRP
jgi:hypothetical protein